MWIGPGLLVNDLFRPFPKLFYPLENLRTNSWIMTFVFRLRGLIHTRYFCTQCCNKNILIILRHKFIMTNQGKLLTKINSRYVRVLKGLPWLVKRNLCLKIIKRQHIFLSFLSQYCAQKYLVCIIPKFNFHKSYKILLFFHLQEGVQHWNCKILAACLGKNFAHWGQKEHYDVHKIFKSRDAFTHTVYA